MDPFLKDFIFVEARDHDMLIYSEPLKDLRRFRLENAMDLMEDFRKTARVFEEVDV